MAMCQDGEQRGKERVRNAQGYTQTRLDLMEIQAGSNNSSTLNP